MANYTRGISTYMYVLVRCPLITALDICMVGGRKLTKGYLIKILCMAFIKICI